MCVFTFELSLFFGGGGGEVRAGAAESLYLVL